MTKFFVPSSPVFIYRDLWIQWSRLLHHSLLLHFSSRGTSTSFHFVQFGSQYARLSKHFSDARFSSRNRSLRFPPFAFRSLPLADGRKLPPFVIPGFNMLNASEIRISVGRSPPSLFLFLKFLRKFFNFYYDFLDFGNSFSESLVQKSNKTILPYPRSFSTSREFGFTRISYS